MRKYRIGFMCFLATLLVAFVAGCGQETVTIPGVVSVTPAQGTVGVAVNTTVTATFSTAMKPGTITAATFTLAGPGGTAVTGAVTYSGATATFAPAANLAYGTTYTATVTNGAATPGGAELLGNFVWTFTTIAPPPVVPAVVSTIPANGAPNVPIGQVLSATFSEAMNPATIIAANFTVTAGGVAVPGTVAYSGEVATFTPNANLANSTVYIATITTGATSAGGTPLAANYSWTFTTITAAPMVTKVVPANGATAVPIAQMLTATFSEAMSPGTLDAATFTVTGPGGITVPGAVTYSGLVATFTPTASLAPSSSYVATITTGAEDLASTGLVTNYIWTFTTVSPALAVTATVPVNTATGVPVDQVLSATFNEPMKCLPFPAAAFTVTGPGATPVPGTIGCSGSDATFTPAANLAFNTLFTVTITTGAQDLAGASLASNYVWTFLTVPAPTVPTVIATVPVNGATAVPINQALTATFSEAMTPASINSATFLLTVKGGASVSGVVTYVAAGSIATFTPDTNLAPDTVYTATITTGATALDGAVLAQNYVWSFTTAALQIVIPPTVISTIPADLALGVPLNQIVSATFSTAMDPATITTITPPTFTLTYVASGVTTPVSGLVAYAAVGNTLTFTPAAPLAPSTTFTATITTAAQDLAGIGLANDKVWTFTTGAAVVVVPPELVSTVPASAATGVPLNQAVSATFSEAMNPLTLTSSTFLLYQGKSASGTPIPATITYDAVSFIATLTPTAPLTASTFYTATVTNGATDLAGNPLGNTGASNPWTFETGAAVVPPPVVLGPTISLFGGFGGTAGMTNQGIETVINGDIGTTAVSTLITGFHDTTVVVGGVDECTYTETPLNIGLVTGTINTAPPPPTVGCPNEGTAATFAIGSQAALEALTAFNTLAAIPGGLDVSLCPGCGGGGAGELGNRTLAPGVYKAAPGSYAISLGDLTLDAKGDPNASWVFQMATTLTVGTPASPESVKLVNGAQAKNVFWQVGTAATINGILGGGTMQGTIISQDAVSISTAGVVAITTLNGRALVLTGPVTMVNTVINIP
jgi:hypothetical protein